MLKFRKKVSPTELTFFFRQLATLISACIPIIQSFEILQQSQKNKLLHHAIIQIIRDLESGNPLSKSLLRFPHLFDQLTCQFIYTGEYSGTLASALDRVALHKEKILFMQKKIKQILLYPIIVMSVALIVTITMLTVVIPRFAELFQSMHSTLPTFTLSIIHLSEFFRQYYWVLFLLIAMIPLLLHRLKNSLTLKLKLEHIVLQVPHLGSLYLKIILSRFSRTLATTFAAGIPINEILKTLAYANSSRLYGRMTLKLQQKIAKGQPLHQAMQQERHYPTLMIEMIKIGEESGTLEKMLEKIASIYEADIDHWITICGHLLEPLIIAILGVLIGGLVVAMYLPIFKLGTVL